MRYWLLQAEKLLCLLLLLETLSLMNALRRPDYSSLEMTRKLFARPSPWEQFPGI